MTSNDALTPSQREMVRVWEEHMSSEFVTKDIEATLATMVPDAYVNHVPVMTGGVGSSSEQLEDVDRELE